MTMKPAHNLWYKPDQIHATIQPDTTSTFGWLVKVWTSPITCYSSYAYTRAGAQRSARRGVARVRRGLERKRTAETIR